MEHASRNRCTLLPWLLAGLLPLAAQATDAPKGGIGHEIGTELAEAVSCLPGAGAYRVEPGPQAGTAVQRPLPTRRIGAAE